MIRQVIFWSAIVLTLSLTHSKQMQNIDAITQAYLTAEKYLWQLIYSTDRYNRLETFAYIYDTHEEHLGKNFGESGRFERLKRMHPMRHSDYRDYRDTRTSTWRVIDAIEEINATALNTYRILSHRTYDSLPHLVNDTGENIPREIASICKHIDEEFWIAAKNSCRVCEPDTVIMYSENQFLMDFYQEIVAALLKGYMVLQMSYMIWTTNEMGNYRETAERVRDRFIYNISLIQDDVKAETRNASRAMWACDPEKFFNTDSYIEISAFYQGYIDNEINLNTDDNCRKSCDDYSIAKHHHCADDTFCAGRENQWDTAKTICNGSVLNCRYMGGDLNFCLAEADSPRRYDFVRYDNGDVFGREHNCRTNMVKSKSWMRWLVFCSNCFCYCDEPGPRSDRYFSLRAVVSNIAANKIVTGVAITKINRIIQLKIVERKLLPNGQVTIENPLGMTFADWKTLPIGEWKAAPSEWKTAAPFHIGDPDIEEGVDYHQLSWKKRSVDLDTLVDLERVVTGVRFRVVDSHLRLEVRVTDFDYQTGQLKDLRHSKWIGNNFRPKRQLVPVRPDLPTRTTKKSMPFLGNNVYINFQPSDIEKDAAQSTIPFIDATPLEASTPLAGVGLHYKTSVGAGGFIAPKLIVFDSGLYITPINDEHYIEEDFRRLRADTNYETAARDREGWRNITGWKNITEEALIHLGLEQEEEKIMNGEHY